MKIKTTFIIEEKDEEILEQAADIIRDYLMDLEDICCDNDKADKFAEDLDTALAIIDDLISEKEKSF